MTVHEALVAYTQTYKYKFPQKHKMIIGALVAKEFRSKNGLNYELPTIISTEENGTFRVFDYPPAFNIYMDNLIHDYVIRLKKSRPKKPKNIIEKPIQNPVRPISYSSDPQKKERKRKPIKQPQFSGKKLINKK